MPEQVKIPMANAEYLARFDRPYVGLIAWDMARILEAIVLALLPFKFRLANTEVVTAGTPADHKVIFKIPERGISFQFGAEEYRFAKEGSSWTTMDEDSQVLMAAEQALLGNSGAKIQSCTIAIAMHLQPLAKTREELLAPFAPEPFRTLMAKRHVETFGNHLKWADGDVLLDFSIPFANGIFLRLSSQFSGLPPLPDILAKVRSDEAAVFEALGIEEARNA